MMIGTPSHQEERHDVFVEINYVSVDTKVINVEATVTNHTENALQFISNRAERGPLLIVSTTEIKKPNVVTLTFPMSTVTVKAHSSVKAQGSMDIGDRQIKDLKSITAKVLQITEASKEL